MAQNARSCWLSRPGERVMALPLADQSQMLLVALPSPVVRTIYCTRQGKFQQTHAVDRWIAAVWQW